MGGEGKCKTTRSSFALPSSALPLNASRDSATLCHMDCPVCGMAFPEGEIEAHVIQCLDEQQVREDERLARELDDAQNGTASGSPSQRVGLFASHVGDGGPSLPKKELPVVRAFRPQRRAVATGEHADRPRQDGVLATLRTDPRQTLLAREEDRENLVGLLHQRFQIGYG